MQSDIDVPSNWYEHFFTGPVNRFWAAMVPPAATAADLDFVIRHLRVTPPARLLDVPCGAGRHALGLAKMGYRVTGIDLSADAIERASGAAVGLPVRFARGDMRSFAAEGHFEGAICLGNSIGYFGTEGMAAFFARLAAALRPDGRLVLDSGTCAESIFPLKEEREIAFHGGRYRARLAYDAMTSTLKTAAELALDGETHALRYAHQIVTCGELVRLLAAAGFVTQALYANPEDATYAPGCPRLLLVAEKA